VVFWQRMDNFCADVAGLIAGNKKRPNVAFLHPHTGGEIIDYLYLTSS